VGAFLVDEPALRTEFLIGVDNLIGGDRVGDALDRDVSTLLAMDSVANVRVGLIGYEDLARRGSSFEAGGEVYAAADDL
jgi:hypothetical protein